ncbi:MAG TPA: hypothetical protein VGF12_07195 [Roseateles sp.]|uniref:hypothetical protein n=1 Tax=Roseateles sp. TaxID=1971397 RepID=UPI002ED88DC9
MQDPYMLPYDPDAKRRVLQSEELEAINANSGGEHVDSGKGVLIRRLRGRADFMRHQNDPKSAGLMSEAADALETLPA